MNWSADLKNVGKNSWLALKDTGVLANKPGIWWVCYILLKQENDIVCKVHELEFLLYIFSQNYYFFNF